MKRLERFQPDCARRARGDLPAEQGAAAIHTYLVNHAAALGARLDVRVQVSGYRAIARLVATGAGIGVVPRSAIQAEEEQSLIMLKLAEPSARRDLRICVRRVADPNYYRDKLVETLRESWTAAAAGESQ